MIRYLRHKLALLFIVAPLVGAALQLTAKAIDYSHWGYSELTQTAMQMCGEKNYREAFKLFDLAIHAEPNNPEGYINRGGIFELLHQSKNAIKDELQAIALAKSNTKEDIRFRRLAHHNMARIYLNNKEFRKAETESNIVIRLCPDNPIAQENHGDILVKIGKRSEALPWYLKAKEYYQKSPSPVQIEILNTKISQSQQVRRSESRKKDRP